MDAIIELWREQSSLCAVTELSLDAPLAHAHYAHADHAAYAAEVMLLTRSLVIRGSAESEYSPGNASNGFMDPTKEDCREFKMNRPCADEILDGYGGHILAEGVNASLHLSNVEPGALPYGADQCARALPRPLTRPLSLDGRGGRARFGAPRVGASLRQI